METGRWTFLIIGLLILLMFTGAVSAADPPAIKWQNVLGGSADDIALSVRQTTDGGYILVGTTLSGSSGGSGSVSQDVLVLRLDSDGHLLWQKVYGGYSDDGGLSIQQTTDGGYILVGFTTVNKYSQGYVSYTTIPTYRTGYNDYTVTTPAYNYPYSGYSKASGYTIYAENSQGTGTSTSYTPSPGESIDRDVWVLKLDPAGNIQWQKILGGTAEDVGAGIQQTNDGGYILVGSTASSGSRDVGSNHGKFDVWVVKLDPAGNLQWQKMLGGYMEDTGSGIRQTNDGGYILVGSTASSSSGDVGLNHGSQDVWVVKLDSTGNLQWQKVLGGGDSDIGSGIRQTARGEFILTGFTVSSSTGDVGINNGRYDVWVVKLDSAGNLQWQKVLGGSAYDYGTGIWPTEDGGYVLTGFTSSSSSGDVGVNHGSNDVWVVKLTSAGDILWQKMLGGYASDRGYGIQQTNDGGYVLAGCTESANSGDIGMNHGANDVWVVKLLPENSAPLTQNIPSVGQAVSSYQVGFDGLMYNADGRNTLDLDLQKARRSMATVAVYSDRVEIYQQAPDGILVTFRGNNFAVREDKITGPVTMADYVTDPIEAPLTPGIVSASVRATFPSLTQPGILRTTIGDRPDPLLIDQFRAVLVKNGLEYDTVAYIYDVRKNAMPPAGNTVVILTLPEQWVNQHGGIGAVRIIRVSDTTGIAEMIPAVYNGTDKKGIMQFRGISINGTSVFGLATLKASAIAKDNNQSLASFPAQQPAITTILGLFGWLLGSIQQNPAGTIAIAATAGAAYAGRRRGMW